MKDKKILMVFIEPTPYILDLLRKGFQDKHDQLDIIFITENASQAWHLPDIPFQIVNTKKSQCSFLKKIFFNRDYALIHLAGWSHPLCILIIFISKIFSVPVVIESDTSFNQSISPIKKIIKSVLYPIYFKFPHFFLAGGVRQQKYLQRYGVHSKKIINAQMTVDIEHIMQSIDQFNQNNREIIRKKNHAKQDDVVFLFLGRLIEGKGVLELLAAFKSLCYSQSKLWIAGDGELKNTVLEFQDHRLSYLGRLSGEVIWETYHAADVFILPAHHEQWGLVINEAMAASKPLIVTTTTGCIDDLVTHGQEGLVIEPFDVDEIKKAMIFMIENPDRREQMGLNARKRISSWTLENEANNMKNAWKTVLCE